MGLLLQETEQAVDGAGLAVVGHRVVHGGAHYTAPQIVTPELLAESKAACEKAISLGPTLANGNNCLGMVFTKTGRYEEAVQQFEQALKLDPTSDDAYRNPNHKQFQLEATLGWQPRTATELPEAARRGDLVYGAR